MSRIAIHHTNAPTILQVKCEAENSQKRANELAAKELHLSTERARQDAIKKELDAGEIMTRLSFPTIQKYSDNLKQRSR